MLKNITLLFILLNGLSFFAQDSIYVDLKIIIHGDTTFSKLPGIYDIELFTETDTFLLKTNRQAVLELSSRDGFQIIQRNQNYSYKVYKDGRYFSEDKFSTHVTSNTRIIRDLHALMFTCARRMDPILFNDSSVALSPEGLRGFQQLSQLVHEEKHLEIEIHGNYNSNTPSELALKRSQYIRDSLLSEGVFPKRLKLAKPKLNDSTSEVSFSILSFDYFPYTGGSIVNFDKTTDTIVETRCDSLRFLANDIAQRSHKYTLIGIYTNREDPKNKKKAIARAKLVREKLIAIGIDKKRLKVNTSYYKPPGKNEQHDWPFYPIQYSYEIGVYIEVEF